MRPWDILMTAVLGYLICGVNSCNNIHCEAYPTGTCKSGYINPIETF